MCSAIFPRVTYVGVFLIERGIHRVLSNVSSGGLCRSFAYRTRKTPCVALFSSAGLCPSFAYRTRHTPCVEQFSLGVWLMSDFCL